MGLRVAGTVKCDSYGCPASADVECELQTSSLGSQTVIIDIVPKLPNGWSVDVPFYHDTGETERRYYCATCTPKRR